MKKMNCPLIGRAGMVLAFGALVATGAHARHLQPAEALSLLDAGQLKSASSTPLKLAYTQEAESGEAAVYVFDREGAPGFYVLAADDAVGDIVLGYSHTDSFTTENIPDNIKWLLEAFSQHVMDCAEGMVMSAPVQIPAEWTEVQPLLTSKWTQTAPYNDLCPEIAGRRAITGCVGVAVGQVMRAHQWPVKGAGSLSYNWAFNLNGQPYDLEISSDFSQHTYDWANMLDSYADGATQAQRMAVAQLIYDCAVTAKTKFLPEGVGSGSSGQLALAAAGMLEYFDYDKSMALRRRGWYSEEDWNAMIYNQISQNLPLLYSGIDHNNAGHAFVLDGYDGNGKFHFNMGWAGLGDGFYSLDGLSYKYSQEAVMGIKKNEGGTQEPEFALLGDFTTNKTQYMSSRDPIYFMSSLGKAGGFISYTLIPVNVEIGIKNTADDSVAKTSKRNFTVSSGYENFGIWSQSFPRGEYDVYPVFRVEGGEWTPLRYDIAETSGRLHFINDGSTIKVNAVPVTGIEDVAAEAFSVKSINGNIHIEAPGDVNVMVYGMTGMLCYSGTDRIIPVEKNHIYIVVINGKAFKVKA